MKQKTIGFIGTGNMGAALATAAAKVTGDLLLSNRTPEKAAALAGKIGGRVSTNLEIASECSMIFLGVKPHLMAGLLASIAPYLSENPNSPVLVTMAAGVTIDQIRQAAGGAFPVIRIMPNTPVAVGAGLISYCWEGVLQEQLDEFQSLMRYAGTLDPLEEGLMDVGSAVSSCGPAYAYQFIEALADGGVACGLPREKALCYAAQTLLGAAQMVLSSGRHPGALKDAVCSPGGSTIQGVRQLEKHGMRSAVMEAVIAAYERNTRLGK